MNDHTDTLRKPHARAPLADLPDLWRHDAKHYSDEAEAAVGLACADELDAAIAALEAGRSGEGEPVGGWAVEPDGHAYRYPSDNGQTVIRFNNGREVNGCAPIEAVPFYLGTPPAPQQPPPVGVTDAINARRYRFLRDVGPPDETGYPTILQWKLVTQDRGNGKLLFGEELDAAIDRELSHQQPAPSVSEGWTCERGHHWQAWMRHAGCPACKNERPVSEPAASKSRTKRIAIEQGKQDPFVPIPGEISSKLVDAASGEGLPELPKSAARLHVQHFRECPSMRNVDLHESEDFAPGSHRLFTAEQMRAYAIEARRLTTTGDDNEHARLYEQLRDEIPATTHGAAIAWIRERTTGQGDVERLPPEPGSDGVPPLPEPDVRYTGPQTFLSHGETRWAYSGEAMLAFRDDGIAYGRRLAARSEGGAS